MNWTGGARSRHSKPNPTAARQRQYFAKVRAKATAGAFMGGSSELGDNEEPAFKRPRKVAVPEFDVVVDQPRISQRSASPLGIWGKGGKEGKRKEGKGKEGMRERRKLLLAEDWGCTKADAVPVKEPSVVSRNGAGGTLPFRMPMQPPPPSPPPKQYRQTPSVSEAATQVRMHPDTGFNAFRELSQGGYIKIGKGRRHVQEERVESSPAFQAIEEEDEEDEEGQRISEGPDSFEPIVSQDVGQEEQKGEEEEEEEEEENVFAGASSHSGPPPPSSPPERPQLEEDEGMAKLLRQIEEAAADTGDEGYFFRIDDKRPRSDTPSLPMTYVTHFVSRAPETIILNDTEEEENGGNEESSDETESDEDGDDHGSVVLPVNPSVVAHISSSAGVEFKGLEPKGSNLNVPVGEKGPRPEELDEVWRKFLKPTGLDDESTITPIGDNIGSSVAGQRGTTIHGEEEATTDDDARKEVQEEPEVEDGGIGIVSVTQSQSDDNGSNTEETELIMDTEARESTKPNDPDATWKQFVAPITKPPAETEPQGIAELRQANTSWKEFVAPGPDAQPAAPPIETRDDPPPSPAITLTLPEDVNKAWRSFVFGRRSSAESSDEDDDFAPPPPPPKKRIGRYPAVQAVTTPVNLSPVRPVTSSPYFSSPGNNKRMAPFLTRMRRDSTGGTVVADSMAGNASSMSSPSTRAHISTAKVAESMRANPSSSSDSAGVMPRRVRTWKRPDRFVASEATVEGREEIEDW